MRNIKQIASFIVLLMLMITAIILQKNGIISDNILSSVIFLLAVSSTLVGLFFSHKKKFKEIEIHFCRFNEFLQSESLSCSLANPPDEGKVCRKGRGFGVATTLNRITTGYLIPEIASQLCPIIATLVTELGTFPG